VPEHAVVNNGAGYTKIQLPEEEVKYLEYKK
jgi:hypothetical protein